jgi:hypothetical protein
MNWGKGLRRLWVVGTAIWIAAVVGYGLRHPEEINYPYLTVADGVLATEQYAEYWYYHIVRPDLVARKHRLPHCVSHEERARLEADLEAEKAKEAKRPPRAPGEMSGADLDRLFMPAECSAEVERAKSEVEDVMDEFPVWLGAEPRDALLLLLYWLLGPPLAALAVGTSLIWAFRWAFRGFRAG